MNTEKILGDCKITLAQMLDARERRAARQAEILAGGAGCLVSFTLNMPGEIKQFPLARAFFERGDLRLKRALQRTKLVVLDEKIFHEATGSAAFLCVDAPPLSVKKIAVSLEESSPASRLYDIDVLDASGAKMARESMGLPPRRCLICGKPVGECAPVRRHSAQELSHTAVRLMYDAECEIFAQRVAGAAQRALLSEVAVSPKPGLVDRFHNGSHRDMDTFSFIDSAVSLRPYLAHCVRLGIENCEGGARECFSALRLPGMEAEDSMLEATGGVNVHRGAIFSFGVLCAARGRLWAMGEAAGVERLSAAVSEMLTDLCADFAESGTSVGRTIYSKTGLTGIRGEAAAGFPSACRVGLPALERRLKDGASLNDAAAFALLEIVAQIDDTNMIKRGGLKRFRAVQAEISKILAKNPSLDDIYELDKIFVSENLSPGGSADMLALSILLHFLRGLEGERAPW